MNNPHYIRLFSTILLAILCLMLFAGLAVAEEKATMTTFKAVAPVTIDGVIDDEWNLSSPIILNDASQLVRDGEFWNGPSDLSAIVYTAWDEENFYIAAEVTEDSIFGAIEMLPLDGEDNFEIFISTNPADDPTRTEYSATDFKIFLIMDGEYWDTAIDRSMVPKDNRKRFITKGMDGGENVLEGYVCAAEQTTVGFTYECAIPWACLSNDEIPVFTPVTGNAVSFNFLITDISYPCPGTEYIPQIAWTGNHEMNKNPSLWGTLVFAQ